MEKLLEALKLAKPETDIEDFITARDLYGQGVIDSMDVIAIVDEINTAFGLAISGADLRREDFATLESLHALIRRHGAV